MELIKNTEEEQAAIDKDRASGFVTIVVKVPILVHVCIQEPAAITISLELERLKKRAERAKMIILDRNVFTNVVGDLGADGGMTLVLTIIGQWATIDAIEEMNRRQAIANAGGMGGRRA